MTTCTIRMRVPKKSKDRRVSDPEEDPPKLNQREREEKKEKRNKRKEIGSLLRRLQMKRLPKAE